MILSSLNEYYKRLVDSEDSDIPEPGYAPQNISFAIVIDESGVWKKTIDLRDAEKKKPEPKTMNTPALESKRSVNVAPNFTWDNTGYVLGLDNKDKPERSLRYFKAFRKLHHQLGDDVQDPGMKALLAFLDSWDPENSDIENKVPFWDEMAGENVVFMLETDVKFLHQRREIKKAWEKHLQREDGEHIGICLVTGEEKPIAKLHPGIKGVPRAQTSGASIVSFNRKSFISYGKERNLNAPVGKDAAFNYATALNYLLKKRGRQKIILGNTAVVFWTQRKSPAELFVAGLFDPSENQADNENIRIFLRTIKQGKFPDELDDPEVEFYILGLSPNSARISIRFWHVGTVGEIVDNIGRHFRDLSLIRGFEDDPEFPGIRRLLLQTAVQWKWDNVKPVLEGHLIRSVLTGAAYPKSLLTAVLERIRADRKITYLRVALIKAYLVRKYRIEQSNKEVTMSLDKESTNVAYRLGRLFAVLEKAQKDAVPGAGTTIKDRYFGSASATPRTVFPYLLRLSQHHIQKAEYGRKNDSLIEEIITGLDSFPAHLTLEDQGLFAIGYYHQRPELFKKSEKTKIKEEE